MDRTKRLAEANPNRYLNSVGDRYDNMLAETFNCLYEAEVI